MYLCLFRSNLLIIIFLLVQLFSLSAQDYRCSLGQIIHKNEISLFGELHDQKANRIADSLILSYILDSSDLALIYFIEQPPSVAYEMELAIHNNDSAGISKYWDMLNLQKERYDQLRSFVKRGLKIRLAGVDVHGEYDFYASAFYQFCNQNPELSKHKLLGYALKLREERISRRKKHKYVDSVFMSVDRILNESVLTSENRYWLTELKQGLADYKVYSKLKKKEKMRFREECMYRNLKRNYQLGTRKEEAFYVGSFGLAHITLSPNPHMPKNWQSLFRQLQNDTLLKPVSNSILLLYPFKLSNLYYANILATFTSQSILTWLAEFSSSIQLFSKLQEDAGIMYVWNLNYYAVSNDK